MRLVSVDESIVLCRLTVLVLKDLDSLKVNSLQGLHVVANIR